ncbi:endonuclease/exonuclease/phosphatase family protein [Pseudoalteromonas shioyasakiensis]|uniref:endonuclease/exonuclease/phosphatase family protein n=1 Tax=Pseudoalteromonas shioyasakiensis TaxID=1190813 RepID=UPI002118F1DC|nr:endonuclease/exonuclease/phosphatase family protein [Pseudoalteromonas shioyasakiensis]MCQ8881414.1 endonuclease/exonuclease/phosphatase family protein [Pseudoalteromonas shioyasakiensis]
MRLILLVIYILIILLAFNQLEGYLFDLVGALRGVLIICSLLPAILLLLWSKKLSFCLVFLSIGLVLFHFKPYSSSEAVKNSDIKIAQVNLQYSNPNLAQIIDSQFLGTQNDILVLFEFNDTQRHVLDELNTQYHLLGYAEVEGAPFGILVISKLPIVQRQIKRFDNPKLGYVKLSFLYNNIMLNSVFFHPPSPRTHTLWSQRNRVLSEVSNEIKNLKGSWLVAGDFNTVPWSRYFIKTKSSCFNRAGFYTSWSFNNQLSDLKVLGLPIDHCLVSEDISLSNVGVNSVNGSDHKLLHYELTFSTH